MRVSDPRCRDARPSRARSVNDHPLAMMLFLTNINVCERREVHGACGHKPIVVVEGRASLSDEPSTLIVTFTCNRYLLLLTYPDD